MSLRDMAIADAALIFGSGDVETVIRWPCGRSGAAVTISAIWEPDETPMREAGIDADQSVTTGSLHVRSTVETEDDDVFVIEDECYATVTRGPILAGLRTLSLKRVDKATTARHQGRYY